MNPGNTDAIAYDPPFARNIQGRLYARFRLGPDGVPEAEQDGGRFHYPIDVFLQSPRAAEIESVEYEIDDPTYYERTGMSTDRANDFREEIWSYGEVPVIVRVWIGGQMYEQRAWLSNMLENGHAGHVTPAIRRAVQRIQFN